jgi:hypothetical protein
MTENRELKVVFDTSVTKEIVAFKLQRESERLGFGIVTTA